MTHPSKHQKNNRHTEREKQSQKKQIHWNFLLSHTMTNLAAVESCPFSTAN